MLLSTPLQQALTADNIAIENYRPAYNGESVGLDLYNAGPTIVIPPVGKLLDFARLVGDSTLANYQTWLDIPESARKAIFKRLVPSGVKAVIPRGYAGIIMERSSITKTPVKLRAGVIDPGYTGEIFINMVNLSDVTYVLEQGQKTPFQLIIYKVTPNFVTVDAEEFQRLTSTSMREEGQIGSSD